MSHTKTTVVLVHGAWADGSSWARVIGSLNARVRGSCGTTSLDLASG